MKIASIGIDIGKTTFHLVALDEHSSIVIRKKFSRKALLAYSAKLTTSLIGMEARRGALPGPTAARARAPGSVDPRAVREALPRGEQERLPGCGSDSRSRHPTRFAVFYWSAGSRSIEGH
jgi:hypothetical protein